MTFAENRPSRVMTLLATILTLANVCSAYRVVQHCKPLGENEHYSACTALTQHYNATTQSSDLFIRYNWYKYRSTSDGWHSFGLGRMMKGALMFIFYGDPTNTAGNDYAPMTFSVRSASGHAQPRPLGELDFLKIPQAEGGTPDVDVVNSHFVPYTGSYVNEKYGETPSHIGVAEFIVRGYTKWVGAAVDNTSTAQPMLWSSRYNQDFGGDFGVDRNIEMHKMGLGFGFVYVDMLHAETPVPMFGPIDESLVGWKGVVEYGSPEAPTDAELQKGQEAIANSNLDAVNSDLGTQADKDQHNPFNDHNTTPSINPPSTDGGTAEQVDNNAGAATGGAVAGGAAAGSGLSRITREKVRNWLWHLHGLLFSLAFFLLYPLGVYFLRSAKHSANGTSFNYHWTIQAMGTLLFAIGAFIGYLQSHAIHLTHQYVGITLALVLGAQMVSGWRHHMRFIAVKRRTWWSYAHLWAGRLCLPVGLLNILSGMKLRQYGWFTMLLALIAVVAEIVLGGIFLWRASKRRANIGNAVAELKSAPPGTGEDAEEYFALAGDDEDEDDSDIEENAAAASAQKKREDKAEENRRLAKLDRV